MKLLFSEGIDPYRFNPGGHLVGNMGKLSCHRRGHIEHVNALRFQADFSQDVFNPLYPATGVRITCQVMAVSRHSTGDDHSIGTGLKGM